MTQAQEPMSLDEFAHLAEATYRMMYRAARSATLNHEDAEDAVQISLLYLLDKLYKKGLYKMKPAFLARNAYLRGIDIVRKARRQAGILENEKLAGCTVVPGESRTIAGGSGSNYKPGQRWIPKEKGDIG